jgi:hypothetical protein
MYTETKNNAVISESGIARNPIARFRLRLSRAIECVPLWAELNALSSVITAPIRTFAELSLLRMPWLSKLEWLFEIRALATRAPFLIVLSAGICAWRGGKTTLYGHIGTDRAIYPLMAALSSFNPYLAVCCAILFGVADLGQKLYVDDIYGAPSRFSLDYGGALTGYVVSYSSLVLMGLAPGVVSRAFRKAMIWVLSRACYADGASEKQHVPSLAEDIAALAGSGLAGWGAMGCGAPVLESAAFDLRPHPDVSCFQTEVGLLRAGAPFAGFGAAAGAVLGPTGTGATSDGLFADPALLHQQPTGGNPGTEPYPPDPPLNDSGAYPGALTFTPQTPVEELMQGLGDNSQTNLPQQHNAGQEVPDASSSSADQSNHEGNETDLSGADNPSGGNPGNGGDGKAGRGGEENDPAGLRAAKVISDVIGSVTPLPAQASDDAAAAAKEIDDFLSREPAIIPDLGREVADGKTFLEHGADAFGAVTAAWDQVNTWNKINAGTATSSFWQLADGAGAAGIGLLIGLNPITATVDGVLNLLGETGVVPGADNLSPGRNADTVLTGVVALDEALTQMSPTDGLQDVNVAPLVDYQNYALSGKGGAGAQLIAEAGKFWAENSLLDGLAQGQKGASIAIKNGINALESFFSQDSSGGKK